MKSFLVFFFFCFMAQAEIRAGGLFLEPALTYQNGSLNLKYPAPVSADSNEDVKGYGLGARLGGHFADILFVAADIRYAQPDYESSALGGGTAKAQALNYGATLGLQTPFFGIRV